MAKKDKEPPKIDVIPVSQIGKTNIYLRVRNGDIQVSEGVGIVTNDRYPNTYLDAFCRTCDSHRRPRSASIAHSRKSLQQQGYTKAQVCEPTPGSHRVCTRLSKKSRGLS